LWLGYWRDVMLVGYGALSPKSNPDRKNEVALFSKGIPKDQIIKSIVAIQDTIKAIESNANLRLVLETLMLDLPRFDMEQVGRK
jgi:hypothetical protein